MFKLRQYLLLLTAAIIWGSGFIAQKLGMEYISPFAFTFFRTLIGGLCLLPVLALMQYRARHTLSPHAFSRNHTGQRRLLLKGSLFCGIFLILAESFQQFGLKYTEVSKASFITSMYIIFVPLLGIFAGLKPGLRVWCGAALSAAGLYLLCLKDSLIPRPGDLLVLVSALCFALHILVIARFAGRVSGVALSCGQFFTASALGLVLMLLTGTDSATSIAAAAPAFIYCGIMSNGVAYTLQITGQRGVNPAVATLILALESAFGALFGAALLHEAPGIRGWCGCTLMFAAVVITIVPFRTGPRSCPSIPDSGGPKKHTA